MIDNFENSTKEYEEAIAWLEKQGEQKTVGKTEPIVEGLTTEFQKQVSHLIASAMDKEHEYTKGYVEWVAQSLLGYAQNEQTHTDKVEPKFKVGDIVINKKSKDTVKIVQILHDSYRYSGWDGVATVHSDFSISEQDNWELVEHKHNWSEEDERKITGISIVLQSWDSYHVSSAGLPSLIPEYISWLKSLKERYNWKPSDEQMKALSAINVTGGISYAGQGQELINLYNDLKKLKGEEL